MMWTEADMALTKTGADDEVWLRRMSNLLDTVENPASMPEGAPGSLHRRAWELGRRLRDRKTVPVDDPDFT